MHNISRPKPPVRLVESRTSCSSLEITEVDPTPKSTTKIIKREGLPLPRSKSKDSIVSCNTQLTVLRVFAGNIRQGTGFKTVMVNANTTAQELVKQAMIKFHIEELEGETTHSEYYATVKGIDGRKYSHTIQLNLSLLLFTQLLHQTNQRLIPKTSLSQYFKH
jgi:sulfur carrier protein ThiS